MGGFRHLFARGDLTAVLLATCITHYLRAHPGDCVVSRRFYELGAHLEGRRFFVFPTGDRAMMPSGENNMR